LVPCLKATSLRTRIWQTSDALWANRDVCRQKLVRVLASSNLRLTPNGYDAFIALYTGSLFTHVIAYPVDHCVEQQRLTWRFRRRLGRLAAINCGKTIYNFENNACTVCTSFHCFIPFLLFQKYHLSNTNFL